jgi:hypothetical protein
LHPFPTNPPQLFAAISFPTAIENYTVKRLGEFSASAWDEFVCDHPQGTIFHTSQWKAAIEDSSPNLRGSVLALLDGESGRICAGVPYFIQGRRWRGQRLISVPHACICPALSSKPRFIQPLFDALLSEARQQHATTIELRWPKATWEMLDSKQHPGTLVEGRTFLHHYLPLNSPLDQIWHSLSRTAVRRMVSKAEKAGLQVTAAIGIEELREFHGLLSQTRHRLGLPAIPLNLLESIWKVLGPDHRTLLLARQGAHIRAGVFCLKGASTFMLEHYGEDSQVRGSGVNSLLYWRALEHAHQFQFSRFSFGRTNQDHEGLSMYKRHWNVTEEEVVHREFSLSLNRKRPQPFKEWVPRSWIRGVLRKLPTSFYNAVSNAFYR